MNRKGQDGGSSGVSWWLIGLVLAIILLLFIFIVYSKSTTESGNILNKIFGLLG